MSNSSQTCTHNRPVPGFCFECETAGAEINLHGARLVDGEWHIYLSDSQSAKLAEIASRPVGDYAGRMRAKADAARRKHGG